jgi:hypothetical protein
LSNPITAAIRILSFPLVRLRLASALLLAVFCTLAGCSGGGSGGGGNSVSLPQLKDVSSAPAAIQQSAKAVVRLRVARSIATGSFISPTGLLLTNNHVLGNSVCPTEGCYVSVTFDWQAGAPYQTPRIYFAVPKAVDVGLDMAVVQFYEYQGGPMIDTPDYLGFQSRQPASLVGTHVTVVGHPEGYLKKWADGLVLDTSGDWIKSTAYTLPGDSGSPILNDAGQIVGLNHRGPTTEDLFTTSGVDMYSVGSASAPLLAALNAPLPNTMISKTAATTTADFLANDLLYLNSRTSTVTIAGASVSALSVLAQACDSALARTDFRSPDDLNSSLTPCYHAETWIDCRTDVTAQPYGTVCPTGAEATAWAARFVKANQVAVAMNGEMDLYSVSSAVAHLQPTVQLGVQAGAQSLQQALIQDDPSLDFWLADYLSQFKVAAYGGKTIKDYITGYEQDPNYQLQGGDLTSAGGWLYSSGQLSRTDYLSLLSRLHGDANASLGTKLYIEDVQHGMGAL